MAHHVRDRARVARTRRRDASRRSAHEAVAAMLLGRERDPLVHAAVRSLQRARVPISTEARDALGCGERGGHRDDPATEWRRRSRDRSTSASALRIASRRGDPRA